MPYSPVEVSRPDRVGADGEERHEAQVQQAGQAERDVQPEAHQHVQRDERDDLGEERAEAERQHEHDGRAGRRAAGMQQRPLRFAPAALARAGVRSWRSRRGPR